MLAQAVGQAWCLACGGVAVGNTCSLVCGCCARHLYLAHQCLELLHQNDQVLLLLLHCTLLLLQLDQSFVVCAPAEVQVQLQCLYCGQHLSWVQILLLCVLACSGLPTLWLQHQWLPLALGHGMSSICPARHCGQPILQLLSGQALELDSAGSPSFVQSSNGPRCQWVGAAVPHQAAPPHVCACYDSSFGPTNSQAPDTAVPQHCSELWPLWEMVAVGPVQSQQDWTPLSPSQPWGRGVWWCRLELARASCATWPPVCGYTTSTWVEHRVGTAHLGLQGFCLLLKLPDGAGQL